MSEVKIAKTLKQACEYGPEHVADLIRQKLTVLVFRLERGDVTIDAIRQFQKDLGMDELPVFFQDEMRKAA